jgi:hypothetical protein
MPEKVYVLSTDDPDDGARRSVTAFFVARLKDPTPFPWMGPMAGR